MKFDAKVQQFADLLPQLIWNYSKSLNGFQVNSRWRDYTGIDQLNPKDWVGLVLHPDDQKKMSVELIQMSETKKFFFSIRARLRHRLGVWNWFLIDITSNKDGWLASAVEVEKIFPKDKTEQALQFLSKAGEILSESLDYETTLKATAVLALDFLADLCLIDLLDEKGNANGNGIGTKSFHRILSLHRDVSKDQQALELMSYSPQKDVGDIVEEVVRSRQGRLIADFCKVLESSDKKNLEYISRLKKLDCCSAFIMPLESHNKLFGAITLIRSSNRGIYSETEINLITEFARRATICIENARLYRQAQLVVEAKTQFVANMSHEIRTPLGVILGFAELLQDKDLTSDQKKNYLDIILRNGHQLLELVGDLLDVSKIELGKIEISHLSISIKELIQDVIATLSIKALEKNIKLYVDFDSETPEKLISDPLRIKQVLINLIGNAIKFSPAGVVRIRAVTEAVDKQYRVIIDIADQGVGIALEKQQQLFQSFVQADVTMTRIYGGVGLGLFLSKKMAQSLGGTVELIFSDVGKGSVFRFTFLADAADEKKVIVSEPTTDTEFVQPLEELSQTKKRILVVEDSLDGQLLISKFLAKLAVDVDQAFNGAEAIQKALERHYDLILMDIQMPLIDGYTATNRLRKMGVSTPIIAVTAHAMLEDRNRCLEAGCNGYMTKPLSKNLFQHTIRSYL